MVGRSGCLAGRPSFHRALATATRMVMCENNVIWSCRVDLVARSFRCASGCRLKSSLYLLRAHRRWAARVGPSSDDPLNASLGHHALLGSARGVGVDFHSNIDVVSGLKQPHIEASPTIVGRTAIHPTIQPLKHLKRKFV